MRITIRYGTENELTEEFPNESTVGSVLETPHVKDFLRYGDNVEGRIGGVPPPDETVLQDGVIITVHDKSCEKSGRVRLDGEGPYQFFFKQIEPLAGEPRHVHVWRDGDEAKFWLEPVECAR